jgi:hypothetical protein
VGTAAPSSRTTSPGRHSRLRQAVLPAGPSHHFGVVLGTDSGDDAKQQVTSPRLAPAGDLAGRIAVACRLPVACRPARRAR